VDEGPEEGLSRRWHYKALVGRLVELTGSGASAALTFAMDVVLQAQCEGELVAWVTASSEGSFFPPDAARMGVDLEALPVVRTSGSKAAAMAADRLLRSGAFGLVVMDLGERAELTLAMQGRLVKLAQLHGAALVALTSTKRTRPRGQEGGQTSLGSMVSLRAEVSRQRRGSGHFVAELVVLKDKRSGPSWRHALECHGPAGLC